LLGQALKDQAVQLVRLPKVLRALRVGRAAMAARIAETADQVPPPPEGRPPIKPGYRPTIERRLATVDLPLEQVRAVRQQGDVTINTVLLTVVALSLKRYLLKRGQLPAQPLATGVMASTEALDAPPRQDGNYFANFMISLGTDIEDPWNQMLAISSYSAEGKVRLERLGFDTQNRLLEFVPPVIGAWRDRRAAAQDTGETRMRASVSFSNVRGAPGYHFLGATVSGLYTYGPLGDRVGLFISSTNLGDTFNLVVNAMPTALEDPEELASSFKDTLSELVSLAASKSTKAD
jgi:diacylglycerol O-acyltransferase